jgi:hypothetical protein
MRMVTIPVLLGVCLTGPGCYFFHIVKQNVIREPIRALEKKVILERHERLAKLAWDEMVAQYGCQFSDDYRDGFIDGFVDYLTYGGCQGMNGESPVVPAVPPPHYRRAKNMSPEGLRAGEEWFMGFRHGANTAMASGLRQLVVVPVFERPVFVGESMPPSASQPVAAPGVAAPAQTLPPPTQMNPADGEPLPPPRPVPAADATPPPAGPVPPPVAPPVPPPPAPPG